MLSSIFAQEAFAQKIVKDQVNADGVRVVDYQPSSAVCSKLIHIEVKDGVILEASYKGGCHGNTQGISALIRGMKVDEAIRKIEGIDCAGRGTSCPDQLAKALKEIKRTSKKK